MHRLGIGRGNPPLLIMSSKIEVVIVHKQTYRLFVNGDNEVSAKEKASKIILKNGDLSKKYLIDDDIEASITKR